MELLKQNHDSTRSGNLMRRYRVSLSPSSVFRIVKDRIEAELKTSRGNNENSGPDPGPESWTPETFLLERHAEAAEGSPSCLNLDSYERIQIASALSQFFQLSEWNAGDNLLRMRTLGDVCQLISDCIHSPGQRWESLCFESSGSMGPPRALIKSRQEMEEECESWRRLLSEPSPASPPKRILSLVPTHHLYGFIWTVMLPESYSDGGSQHLDGGSAAQGGLAVLDARSWGAARWAAELRAGDWIVAFPFRWECWLRMAPKIPAGVGGVSSAGSLAAPLWSELKNKGLGRLIEVYGSSESGGVATRESSGAPFDLAPHWRARQHNLASLLADEIETAGPGRFHLLGRKDGSVKIRGVLVSLSEVERQFREHPAVADCRVRLRQRPVAGANEADVEALILPADPQRNEAELQNELQRDLFLPLGPAAWPKRFVFSPKLPLNSLGKAVNW